jgi:hypothetical protein
VSAQQNWRAAAGEFAEVVQRISPRIALVGFVCAGIAAVPTIIRYYSVFG